MTALGNAKITLYIILAVIGKRMSNADTFNVLAPFKNWCTKKDAVGSENP